MLLSKSFGMAVELVQYTVFVLLAPISALTSLWPVALGYGPWAEEVLANCLSNAIKYGGGFILADG